jgi:DNA invertase Pin-like site-specific DNA recombinase
MLDYVREDDIVYVHSMDRLARTVIELKTIVDQLVKMGVKVVFLKESLTFDSTDNAMSNLTLSLMGAFAEFEYAFIKERQREGIAAAKSKGKYKGRKKSIQEDRLPEVRRLLQTNRSKTQICQELKISRQSLYRYIRQHDLLNPELVKA